MLEVREVEDGTHPEAPSHGAAHGRAGLDLAPDMVDDQRHH
jgi:hypothetical protein